MWIFFFYVSSLFRTCGIMFLHNIPSFVALSTLPFSGSAMNSHKNIRYVVRCFLLALDVPCGCQILQAPLPRCVSF